MTFQVQRHKVMKWTSIVRGMEMEMETAPLVSVCDKKITQSHPDYIVKNMWIYRRVVMNNLYI